MRSTMACLQEHLAAGALDVFWCPGYTALFHNGGVYGAQRRLLPACHWVETCARMLRHRSGPGRPEELPSLRNVLAKSPGHMTVANMAAAPRL